MTFQPLVPKRVNINRTPEQVVEDCFTVLDWFPVDARAVMPRGMTEEWLRFIVFVEYDRLLSEWDEDSVNDGTLLQQTRDRTKERLAIMQRNESRFPEFLDENAPIGKVGEYREGVNHSGNYDIGDAMRDGSHRFYRAASKFVEARGGEALNHMVDTGAHPQTGEWTVYLRVSTRMTDNRYADEWELAQHDIVHWTVWPMHTRSAEVDAELSPYPYSEEWEGEFGVMGNINFTC